jgi:DNA polymerase-1
MYVPTGDIAVYYKNLLDRIKAARKAILDMPECKPHLAELHAAQIAQVKEEEPTKFTATGAVAKRWESWSKRLEETKKEVVFNVNSGPQKEWLFYDRMGYEPRKTTESGRRSTDKKVLPWLGPVGQALVAYNKLTAEKRYVKPCWLMSEEGNGIIYPIINSNGTVTHRTSGGGGSAVKHKFNLQQQPKVRAYLNCIKARPGHAIVHFDFPSLENRVLAAASRDENLLKLYGPGRPKNCGYLFLASRVPGLDVVKELYDPDNPVRLDEAKKKFKRERSVAKVAELALAYGAGAEKIQLELALAGFPMELSEVEAIVRARKALYPRVGQLELELEQEWNRNGGYIFDAFGYPHPIDGRLLKDRINRYCQTSGHRLLLALNYKIHLLRREREVPMTPWIPDYHDETMWEVPEQFVNEAVSIVEDAVDWVDKQVNISIVSFKDAVSVSYTLGEIKCED